MPSSCASGDGAGVAGAWAACGALVAGWLRHARNHDCSDSRVSPELVFDQSLGDLVVIRTAGNVADPVGLGSIEYAVDHLHSTVLVVLGHQKCGAVAAACSGDKMPSRNLEAIVDKINPAVTQAKTYAKPDDLLEAAVKENVHPERERRARQQRNPARRGESRQVDGHRGGVSVR